MTTVPERTWWHGRGCGAEFTTGDSDVRPSVCPKCRQPAVLDDLGWRVGYNAQTYAYYATYEAARRDKRVS